MVIVWPIKYGGNTKYLTEIYATSFTISHLIFNSIKQKLVKKRYFDGLLTHGWNGNDLKYITFL